VSLGTAEMNVVTLASVGTVFWTVFWDAIVDGRIVSAPPHPGTA
jgi:hypothetical protein